ncbi:MAG: glycosyltransferase family 4 protein [Planctomycetes bacterium]|nr:glycosyltransferase family 4 protein [Planctomycetota bacterium]
MPPQPILFCSHVVEWGGAETVLADLLGALDRSRFAPHLACPAAGPLPDRARALGVPVHALSLRGGSAFTKLCSLPRAARELRHIAREIGAPLVYANSMIAGYAAVLAQGPQLACLWHLHIVTQSRVARFALRRSRAVITPSRAGALAVDARMAASKRLTIVPNGVAEAFFTARSTGLREALGLPPGTGLVGMFGRLDPHKGHEVLLRAMARLPDSAHAVIVGGEAFADSLARVRGYPERLRAVAAQGGLEPRVHFLGHRDDIAALMSQCDVVAVPSTALESAPRAVAEAQAAGRAVVGSRIGGIPELIEPGVTGLLCAPGDEHELAESIGSLLADEALRRRLGTAARAHAERHYTLAQFARTVEVTCARVLAEAARGS